MKTAFAIAMLAYATSAFAFATLVYESQGPMGHRLCHYSDGQVIDVGFSVCPRSI